MATVLSEKYITVQMRNTIERLKQDKKLTVTIAAGGILFLLLILVLMSKSADDLYADLELVSAGEATILEKHYDRKTLVENELESARVGLRNDLSAAGVDESTPLEPLLQKATSYLSSPQATQQWLTAEMQRISVPREEWQIEQLDSRRHQVTAGDQCFTATKKGLRWKIAAISTCSSS